MNSTSPITHQRAAAWDCQLYFGLRHTCAAAAGDMLAMSAWNNETRHQQYLAMLLSGTTDSVETKIDTAGTALLTLGRQ